MQVPPRDPAASPPVLARFAWPLLGTGPVDCPPPPRPPAGTAPARRSPARAPARAPAGGPPSRLGACLQGLCDRLLPARRTEREYRAHLRAVFLPPAGSPASVHPADHERAPRAVDRPPPEPRLPQPRLLRLVLANGSDRYELQLPGCHAQGTITAYALRGQGRLYHETMPRGPGLLPAGRGLPALNMLRVQLGAAGHAHVIPPGRFEPFAQARAAFDPDELPDEALRDFHNAAPAGLPLLALTWALPRRGPGAPDWSCGDDPAAADNLQRAGAVVMSCLRPGEDGLTRRHWMLLAALLPCQGERYVLLDPASPQPRYLQARSLPEALARACLPLGSPERVGDATCWKHRCRVLYPLPAQDPARVEF